MPGKQPSDRQALGTAFQGHARLTTSFLAQLLSFVATVANRILLTALLVRVWGPEQLADWIVVLSIAAVFGLPDAWLQVQIGNLFHAAYADRQYKHLNRLVGISISVYAILYATIFLLFLICFYQIDLPTRLNLDGLQWTEAMWLIALLAADRAIISLRGSVIQLYRASGDLTRQINSTTVLILLSTASVGIAVIAGASAIGAAATMLIADIVFGLMLLLVDLKRRMPWLSFRPALPTGDEVRRMGTNVPWYAIDHSGQILVNEIPTILLAAAKVDARLIVLFVLTRTVVNLLRQVQGAAANSLGFEIADRTYSTKQPVPSDALYRAANFLALGSAVLAAIVASQAQLAMALWSGRSDLFDPVVFLLLLVPVVLTAPVTVMAVTLSYTNRPRPNAIARLVQIAVLAVGSILPTSDRLMAIVVSLAVAEIIAQSIALPLMLRATALRFSISQYFVIHARSLVVFAVAAGVALLVHDDRSAWNALLWNGMTSSLLAVIVGFLVSTPWERRQIRFAANAVRAFLPSPRRLPPDS